MDFELSDEQRMFRDMTREFKQRELTLEVIKEHERQHKFPYEIIRKMAPLGLTGDIAPQEYGGLGIDWISHGLISEEIGGGWFSLCLAIQLVQTGLVEYPIAAFGSEIQKQRYLPPLIKAEKIGALATVEPNVGSDGAAIEATATLEGDSWVINGVKTWITNGSIADICIISAQTDKSKGMGGLALFFVDKGTPGFTAKDIEPKTGVVSTPTSELRFNDCRIPKENLLGTIGRGFQIAMAGISNVRYSLSAGCTGMAQSCIDTSIKYAQERKQFGKPIGKFQLIQEIIADAIAKTDASRLLSYRAFYLVGKGVPCKKETSMAKAYATELGIEVTSKTLEILGAHGIWEEYPMERYFRDARVQTFPEGTTEIHKLIIGQEALGMQAFV